MPLVRPTDELERPSNHTGGIRCFDLFVEMSSGFYAFITWQEWPRERGRVLPFASSWDWRNYDGLPQQQFYNRWRIVAEKS
jgi:hypothetical protein